MIRILALVCVSLAALSGAASGQTLDPPRPSLKPDVVVTGDLVYVGDIVANSGVIARVPIFRAPDLGQTGTVSAAAVIEAVRAHALVGLDPGNVREVTVTRASRAIPASEIEAGIALALSSQHGLGEPADIAVTFDREMQTLHVDVNAKGEPRVARVVYDKRTNRFEAAIELPTDTASRGVLRVSGRAVATVEVATIARGVERGAILRDTDFAMERRPRADAGRDVITDRAQVIGLAARASMQAGKILRSADLMKPELVQRGETVTMTYELPGMLLTMRGKAMESGADGDVIAVLNEQTKRTLQGRVIGQGRVLITNGSPRLAANLPPGAR